MEISLQHFLETGTLGDIHLGMEIKNIQAICGTPTEVAIATSINRTEIWKYNAVELYISAINNLCTMIFIESSGHPLKFNWLKRWRLIDWELPAGSKQSEIETYLRSLKLPFKEIRHGQYETGIIHINFDDIDGLYALTAYKT